MGAPAFVAKSEVKNTSSAISTVNIDIPGAGAGVTAGMRALLILAIRTATATDPSDWTVLFDSDGVATNSAGRMYLWTVEIGSAESVDPGDTISITLSGAASFTCALLVYEDSTVAGSAFTDPQGAGAASVTTPVASDVDGEVKVVHMYGCMEQNAASDGDLSWTPHVETTERSDMSTDWTSTFRNSTHMVADETFEASGSTTGRTATPSAAVQIAAFTVALDTGEAPIPEDLIVEAPVMQTFTTMLEPTIIAEQLLVTEEFSVETSMVVPQSIVFSPVEYPEGEWETKQDYRYAYYLGNTS